MDTFSRAGFRARGVRAAPLLLALLAVLAAGPGAHAGAETAPEPGQPAGARGAVTNLPIPRYVSMRADSANARRGPSFDQRVDWEFVHRGLPLEVTAEYGHWRRVRDADGYGGWVHHTLLSGVRTAMVRGEAPVALHAAPTEASAVRAMAEPGAIGRIEACEGAWCEIVAAGLEGWLPRVALWGVGVDETIE